MRRSLGMTNLVGLILSTLIILVLGTACVLATEESAAGGGSTPGTSTPESTQTVTTKVEGTVESVAVEAQLLTLTTADGETLVVSVDQDTVVTVNGSTGGLAEIKPGDTVELAVDETNSVATSITVEGNSSDTEDSTQQTEKGKVENVEPEARLLVLTTADGEERVVSVDQSTIITINGSEGTLEDIQTGDSVEVKVKEGTDVTTSVTVERGEDVAEAESQGKVESVDPETGQLTVALASNDTLTVNVNQSTVITVNGSTGSLQDVQSGDSVKVEIDRESNVATAITVEDDSSDQETPTPGKETATPEAQQGTVERVDADTGEITVALSGSDAVTVKVDQSTVVTINGSAGSLEDIQVGDTVEVEVDQDSNVATSITVENESSDTGTPTPEAQAQQGTVESIDADSGEITVALTGSETVTVNVNQSTVVTINGSAGSVEDIQVGDTVEVEMDDDSDVATSIAVQGDTQVTTSSGEITQVDPISQTVTVETQDNQVLHLRLLMLDAGTQIVIDGGQGSLIDLAQGTSAEVTYNPETMVVTKIHVQTSGNGGAEGDSYSP